MNGSFQEGRLENAQTGHLLIGKLHQISVMHGPMVSRPNLLRLAAFLK